MQFARADRFCSVVPKRVTWMHFIAVFFWFGCWLIPLFGQVERLEITARMPLDDGKIFGKVGSYEIVLANAHLAIDPKSPENKVINDLDLAIPDADGLVRYRAQIFVIRPLNPNKANGTLLVDIPNRGNPVSMFFNYPEYMFRAGELPQTVTGDGFLMKQGFTLAGIGWQTDVPLGNDPQFTFRLSQPKVREVEGLVRTDAVFSNPTQVMRLGHWGHLGYPVANPDDPRNQLTVRDRDTNPRRIIPRSQWHFGRRENGELIRDLEAISLVEGSFDKGKIYELVYVSKKPRVIGLGMTAIRDVVAYLRHHQASPVKIDRTIAYGVSQTGRLLRHFLYLGLNADLQDRPVFDGIYATVAGGGRGNFNHRFAQPSRASIPFQMFGYPTDLFPFSGKTQKDPISGQEDGLFARFSKPATIPKTFFINTGYEYWGRAASLLHTSPDGKSDIKPHPKIRIYHLASVQHGPARFPLNNVYLDRPDQKIAGRHLLNPANYIWCDRALILALQAWIETETAPPPNQIPTLADGSLVPYHAYAFPALNHVLMPQGPYLARFFDYGQRFQSRGILDQRPPSYGPAYGVLVPQVDADGNERGGIHLPEIAVPLATHTAWNLRDPDIGAADQLMALAGAFLPFPINAAQRQATNDPRLSIAERYPTREDYIGKFTEAAVDLINQKLLLPQDLPSMVRYASFLWDYVHQTAAKTE